MRWRIMQGDTRESMRTMDAASVQTCVTSPPYFGLRDYGHSGQIGREPSVGQYVEALVDVFREVRRVLRDDGTLWLNLGDSYAAERGGTAMPAQTVAGGEGGKGDIVAHRGMGGDYQPHRKASAMGLKHKDLIGIPWRVAFALQADGWYLRQDIIWHKPNPMPESVRDRCTKSHEYLFLLAKSERYYFDAEAIKEPANPKNHRDSRGIRRTAPGTTPHDGFRDGRRYDTRNRRSVWSITTKPYNNAHFAVFPEALVKPCVLAGSKPSDLVLDPFAGSGTTLAVALKHNRRAIGCELNPEYVALAEARIAEATKQPSLFVRTA